MTYLYNNLKVDLGTQFGQIYLNVVIMNNLSLNKNCSCASKEHFSSKLFNLILKRKH